MADWDMPFLALVIVSITNHANTTSTELNKKQPSIDIIPEVNLQRYAIKISAKRPFLPVVSSIQSNDVPIRDSMVELNYQRDYLLLKSANGKLLRFFSSHE